VGKVDLDLGVAFLERDADAGERAAGADRAGKAIDLAVSLLPDLGAGRLIMPAPVGEVVELVGPDGTIGLIRRDFLGELAGIARVVHRVGVRDRGDEAQIDAAQPQHVLLFLALRLGHHNDGAVAARVAHQRQADAGVSRGPFDDDAARTQPALLLGILDDKERRPILDRAAGIEELGFAEDRAPGLLRGAPQLDQWRVADRADKAVADLHTVLRKRARRPRLSAARAGAQHSCYFRGLPDGLEPT